MRPQFETPEDLSREWSAVAEFGLMVNERIAPREFGFVKIPEVNDGHIVLDYWILDTAKNVYVGVLEFKYRNYSFDGLMDLGGAYIAKAKYDDLMSYTELEQIKPVLLISFNGDLRYLPLHLPHSTECGQSRDSRVDPPFVEETIIFTDASNWCKVPLSNKE